MSSQPIYIIFIPIGKCSRLFLNGKIICLNFNMDIANCHVWRTAEFSYTLIYPGTLYLALLTIQSALKLIIVISKSVAKQNLASIFVLCMMRVEEKCINPEWGFYMSDVVFIQEEERSVYYHRQIFILRPSSFPLRKQ